MVHFVDAVLAGSCAAPAPVVEFVDPTPAASCAAPAPVVEFDDPTPAVSCAGPSPVVEFIDPIPAVSHAAPAPVVEFIDPTPAVSCASSAAPVVVFGTPAPAVSLAAPAPVVDSFDPTPVVSCAASASKAISPATVLSQSPAPVVDWRRLHGSVPEQSSIACRGDDLSLPSRWRRQDMVDGRVYYWNVHTRQTQWQPPVLVSCDVEEDDESEEEDDLDEMDVTQYRFPAGFMPRRMCRWHAPFRELLAGEGCMFAHKVDELHPRARLS